MLGQPDQFSLHRARPAALSRQPLYGTVPPLAETQDLPAADETASAPTVRFTDLGLSDTMLAALEHVGYEVPSPVQAGIIPRILAGADVLGQARTGTGKTASFGIPILEKLDQPGRSHQPRALVMVPTRELAVQVRDESERLSHGRKVRATAIYGVKPLKTKRARLQKGAAIESHVQISPDNVRTGNPVNKRN